MVERGRSAVTLGRWTSLVAPRLIGLALGAVVLATGGAQGCQSAPPADPPTAQAPVVYEATVVSQRPHDPSAYTQGLELVDGRFVESTGLYGSSSIRLVQPADGTVLDLTPLTADLFGEGATVVDETIWQITWRSGVAIRYRLSDLTEIDRVTYQGEGWGLCHDGQRLVMSDGTDTLTFRDPETFAVLGTVAVTDEGNPVRSINELECVDGRVWANLWLTTNLVEIDPTSGEVTGRVDIADLVPPEAADSTDNVANGIAHDDATGHFYLTGKRWSVLYEVELEPVG